MRLDSSYSQPELKKWLLELGYDQLSRENTGHIYLNREKDTCLIIDTDICSLKEYPYVAYTSRQNELMAVHDQVFRFLFDTTSTFQHIKEDILIFLNGESDPEKVKRFGGNRTEQEPDPTLPDIEERELE